MYKRLARFNFSKKIQSDIVKFDYSDLLNPNKDLSELIDRAYNLDGLGIAVVKNIPNYMQLRQKTLQQGYTMYKISDRMEKYKRPEYNYEIGWSLGASKTENITPTDILHGVFSTKSKLKLTGPENYPQEPELEGFQGNYEQMRDLFTSILHMKLRHFDKYLHQINPNISNTLFQDYLKVHETQNELLAYFPFNTIPEEDREYYRNKLLWIGWHRDYSCFTILSRAKYFDTDGNELKGIPAGLTIKNRKGDQLKVDFDEGEIAIQVGDIAYVLSGGILNSTPHTVDIIGQLPDNVFRTTYVQFIDPHEDSIIKPPDGITLEEVLKRDPLKQDHTMIKSFTSGLSFKDFGKSTYNQF